MSELTRTYARRVLDTLKDPAIRSQAQVVLRSPEMTTLTGMLRSSLHGEPRTPVPADTPAADAASPGDPAVNPLQQPTQDFAVSPTLVLDRAELNPPRHRRHRRTPEPATPVTPAPPDQRRGIPDWVLPKESQSERRRPPADTSSRTTDNEVTGSS